MDRMIEEKLQQAVEIMKEMDLDAWLTFVRESETVYDPSLDMVAGIETTIVLNQIHERTALPLKQGR